MIVSKFSTCAIDVCISKAIPKMSQDRLYAANLNSRSPSSNHFVHSLFLFNTSIDASDTEPDSDQLMPSCFCLLGYDKVVHLFPSAESVAIGTGLWNPLGRSSPTARSFYVCHFQGNYKENERVGQDSQLRPQFSSPIFPETHKGKQG